ncbi:MAG: RNA polymerase sigma factor FliA [Pseudomonadales bacterium]
MGEQGIAAYAACGASEEQLVERYAQLVKRIAHHLMGRLPDSVQVEDLIQAGMLGLLEAASKYDGSRGASFETYAGIRIRGAMLDEVRRGDWAPRSVHRNARRVAEAVRAVESRTGREAHDRDIAGAMGITLEEYNRMLSDAAGCRLFSYEALTETDDQAEPISDDGVASGFERQAFRGHLAEAIAGLPEREQLVLALYYDEELNLKEIGAVLGVSESRVSQIMSQTMLRLRARLGAWLEAAS